MKSYKRSEAFHYRTRFTSVMTIFLLTSNTCIVYLQSLHAMILLLQLGCNNDDNKVYFSHREVSRTLWPLINIILFLRHTRLSRHLLLDSNLNTFVWFSSSSISRFSLYITIKKNLSSAHCNSLPLYKIAQYDNRMKIVNLLFAELLKSM